MEHPPLPVVLVVVIAVGAASLCDATAEDVANRDCRGERPRKWSVGVIGLLRGHEHCHDPSDQAENSVVRNDASSRSASWCAER